MKTYLVKTNSYGLKRLTTILDIKRTIYLTFKNNNDIIINTFEICIYYVPRSLTAHIEDQPTASLSITTLDPFTQSSRSSHCCKQKISVYLPIQDLVNIVYSYLNCKSMVSDFTTSECVIVGEEIRVIYFDYFVVDPVPY